MTSYLSRRKSAEIAFSSKLSSFCVTRSSMSFFINFFSDDRKSENLSISIKVRDYTDELAQIWNQMVIRNMTQNILCFFANLSFI